MKETKKRTIASTKFWEFRVKLTRYFYILTFRLYFTIILKISVLTAIGFISAKTYHSLYLFLL